MTTPPTIAYVSFGCHMAIWILRILIGSWKTCRAIYSRTVLGPSSLLLASRGNMHELRLCRRTNPPSPYTGAGTNDLEIDIPSISKRLCCNYASGRLFRRKVIGRMVITDDESDHNKLYKATAATIRTIRTTIEVM